MRSARLNAALVSPCESVTIKAGYVSGSLGIWREPTSAHCQVWCTVSTPSGVAISLHDISNSSSSCRILTISSFMRSIGAASSHCSRGGGSVPCWKYGASSSPSKVSKYSVPSLSAERLSGGLSVMVGSSTSSSVSESSGSYGASEMKRLAVLNCCIIRHYNPLSARYPGPGDFGIGVEYRWGCEGAGLCSSGWRMVGYGRGLPPNSRYPVVDGPLPLNGWMLIVSPLRLYQFELV